MRCELSARQLSSASNSLLHMVSRGGGQTGIRGREKLLYAGFQVCRWLSKPRPVELTHVCLCEVLILAAQSSRHVNIADAERAPQRGTYGQYHIVKSACVPGPTVEETTHIGVLPQPEEMGDAIRHRDEIALLAPIRVRWVRGPKQHDLTGSDDLVVGLPDHTGHTALVGFTWPVDIKKLYAGPTRGGRLSIRDFPQHPLIEHIFTSRIEVQGLQLCRRGTIIKPVGPVAIRRRTRRVQEGALLTCTPGPQRLRIGHVVGVQQIPIGFRRTTA